MLSNNSTTDDDTMLQLFRVIVGRLSSRRAMINLIVNWV